MAKRRQRRPRLTPVERLTRALVPVAAVLAFTAVWVVSERDSVRSFLDSESVSVVAEPVTAPMQAAANAARSGGLPLPNASELADRLSSLRQALVDRAAVPSAGAPSSFDDAKRMLMAQVVPHHPRVDHYCGCSYTARLDVIPSSCELQVSLYRDREDRIEWEHVVPASDFGRQRACWRSPPPGVDGRAHCRTVDPQFRAMEGDPHNLIPVVGALNAVRSNHRFGMVPPGSELDVVQGCGFKVSAPPGRFIEPPDAAKGLVARTYFYMESRYGLAISRGQRQLFAAWDRQFPPSEDEIARARRIEAITGMVHPYSVAR